MENSAADVLMHFLNRAAGTLIDLDPDGKRQLAALEGKVFCLDITLPPVKLYLVPGNEGIQFRRRAEAEPDVTLTGSAMAFARLGAAGGALTEGQITVNGDAELGQALQKVLRELDLDWEELLARQIGDTPARKIGNLLRGLADWAGESVDLSRQNLGDYLKEEKRILVTEPAMERFEEEVHELRTDVDRLDRRVEKLKRHLGEGFDRRD